MRISIFTIGTQGDIRPFAAFGRHLRTLGHDVTIVTSDRHRSLIDAARLRHVAIESDFAALMAREGAVVDDANQLQIARRMARSMMEWMPQWAERAMDATEDADLVLGSGSGTVLGRAVAERRGLPFVQTQFMPLTPSRDFAPIWPSPGLQLPGALNLALWHVVRLAVWRVMATPNTAMRRALAVPPLPWGGPWYSRDAKMRTAPTLYPFSRHLQPQPRDWPKSEADVVGFWFFDQAADWTPPAALRDFLAAGPAPIYIGFGSMFSRRSDSLTQLVLDALRRSGRRAIIATGWGALKAIDTQQDVLFVDHVPHDWLFPRVSLAVHHGGAGTTAAATRAGLPQVVVPFMTDQAYWSWRLNRSGLNPTLLDSKTVTADTLAKAIAQSDSEGMRTTAHRLGASLEAEDGLANAVAALERWGMLPASRPAASPAASIPADALRAAGVRA